MNPLPSPTKLIYPVSHDTADRESKMPAASTDSLNGVNLSYVSSQQPLSKSRQEIRLLELQPAENISDPVVCRLVNVKLKDHPDFIALSALYGDLGETERISINGTRISIPRALGDAIRHARAVFLHSSVQATQESQKEPTPMRTPVKRPGWLSRFFRTLLSDEKTSYKPLMLWVDALCVDRNNTSEYEQCLQNKTINMVYSQARMTVGWLGMKDDTTDLGVETVRAIDAVIPPHWGEPEDRKENPQNYAPRHEWMVQIQHFWADSPSLEHLLQTPPYVGLFNILMRPYFQRDWILKELSSSRYPAFLIGDSILSWEQILRLIVLMEEVRECDSDIFPRANRETVPNHKMPLEGIYTLLRDFERRKLERGLKLEQSSKDKNDNSTLAPDEIAVGRTSNVASSRSFSSAGSKGSSKWA